MLISAIRWVDDFSQWNLIVRSVLTSNGEFSDSVHSAGA